MINALELAVFVILIGLSIYLGKSLTIVFGGSLVWGILIPIISIVSFYLRPLKKQLLSIEILILDIIIINFLNYIFITKSLSILYTSNIYFITLLILVFIMITTIFDLTSPPKEKIEDENVNILRQNFKTIVQIYTWEMLVYPMVACAVFIGTSYASSSNKGIINLIPSTFIFIPIFISVMFIHINEWAPSRLTTIVKREFNIINFDFMKKIFNFLMICMAITGSVIEYFSRNNLLFWIENIVFIYLFILFVGMVMKSSLETPKDDKISVKSIKTISNYLKFVCVNFVGLLIIFFLYITLIP